MEPTTKVSIGGLAFNLNDQAYSLISSYMQTLSNHFENNPEKSEIIGDIEARMSELLMMRLKKSENVVNFADAQQIINIMGNPKDFGDQDVEINDNHLDQPLPEANMEKPVDNFKKRLYRDTENKILGGICSGVGNYLKMDPVLVRLIFVLFLILMYVISFKAGMLVSLFYIALIIIIPKAKTFEEKMAMKGNNPSIENIILRESRASVQNRTSTLGDILSVILKVLLGLLAVGIGILLFVLIVFMIWLFFDKEVVNVTNYFVLKGADTFYIWLAWAFVILLPLIGLFWMLIKILAKSNFTTSTLAGFIIGLLIWLGSLGMLISSDSWGLKEMKGEASARIDETVELASNTLYVSLADEYNNAEQQPHIENLYYTDNKKRSLFILPSVRIENHSDSLIQNFDICIEQKIFGKSILTAQNKADDISSFFQLKDSVLTLFPEWYDNDRQASDQTTIIIKKPIVKKVILRGPLKEFYQNDIHHFGEEPFSIQKKTNRKGIVINFPANLSAPSIEVKVNTGEDSTMIKIYN